MKFISSILTLALIIFSIKAFKECAYDTSPSHLGRYATCQSGSTTCPLPDESKKIAEEQEVPVREKEEIEEKETKQKRQFYGDFVM